MISARRLSDLLAALYAAPTDDTQWQVFLNDLCEQIQAQIGIFTATNVKNGSGEILAQGGIAYNPEMQRRYNEYYGQVDPYRIAFLRNPRIGPIVGEELVAPKEAEKAEFYNDLPTGAAFDGSSCRIDAQRRRSNQRLARSEAAAISRTFR